MSNRAERERQNRNFLKQKVDVHINKLIIQLLLVKPDNVLEFINNWSGSEMRGLGMKVDQPNDNDEEKTGNKQRIVMDMGMDGEPKSDEEEEEGQDGNDQQPPAKEEPEADKEAVQEETEELQPAE